MRRDGFARRLGALVLVAAGMTIAPVAPSSGAVPKAIWGPLDLPNGDSAFALYERLGVDVFQLQLDFARVAGDAPARPRDPADPAYLWPDELDEALARARRHGIAVALLVNRSPDWANGGRGPIWAPRPRAFADFVQAASRRYPAVRRWMIWGEPNRSDRFQPGGRSAPGAYARLLDAAYRGLKRASRRNRVIGGMTWTGGEIMPARFVKRLRLPGGRRPRLDLYGHNPFPFRFPRLASELIPGGWRDFSDLDVFSREVARAFPGNPRLWLSEFTVQSDQRSLVFNLFVSQREQARWLRAAFGIVNRMSAIAGLGWLGLLDQPPGLQSAHWGLMTHEGIPKPALKAFRDAP